MYEKIESSLIRYILNTVPLHPLLITSPPPALYSRSPTPLFPLQKITGIQMKTAKQD